MTTQVTGSPGRSIQFGFGRSCSNALAARCADPSIPTPSPFFFVQAITAAVQGEGVGPNKSDKQIVLYRRIWQTAETYVETILETVDGSLPEVSPSFYRRFGGLDTVLGHDEKNTI